MAEEKDIETLEGGDSESELGQEYGEGKAKATDVEDKSSSEEGDVGKEPEEHRFEDGDDEWDKNQEGADLEDSGEEEKKEESTEKDKGEGEEFEIELDEAPKVGEKLEVDGKEYTVSEVVDDSEAGSPEDARDKQAQEDVIKYLDEEGGGGTKYKIKGVEYDMRDLTPQEFRNRFSLAGRAYERFEEVSTREKQLIERERLAEEGARRSQDIMRKYGETDREPGKDDSNLPDILKPDEDDTDLEKSLKEMNANLYGKVDKLERGVEQQDDRAKEQYLYRELDSLQSEFPMMSKSEVVAVVSMPEYSDVDIRVIAENSHNERMGDKYLDEVFKARPDKLREIEEKAVEKHLTGKPNVRKVSRRPSSTVTSGKISSKKKEGGWTFDKIEAHEDEMRKGYQESLRDVD